MLIQCRRASFAARRVRVVCFHSAGCAEDMFSSEGTGTRRAPSPLLVRNGHSALC